MRRLYWISMTILAKHPDTKMFVDSVVTSQVNSEWTVGYFGISGRKWLDYAAKFLSEKRISLAHSEAIILRLKSCISLLRVKMHIPKHSFEGVQ